MARTSHWCIYDKYQCILYMKVMDVLKIVISVCWRDFSLNDNRYTNIIK